MRLAFEEETRARTLSNESSCRDAVHEQRHTSLLEVQNSSPPVLDETTTRSK